MPALTDNALRRSPRFPMSERVRVSWQDPGGSPHVGYGRGIDISEVGLAILTDEPIPVRSYVQFEIRKLRLHGSGSVRFCKRKGLKQIVGLEFSGSFRWNSVKNPLP